MAVSVTVNGLTFEIAQTGERGWGDDTTNWIVEVSDILSGINNVGDISYRNQITINNNQAVASNVQEMKFDNTITRSAVIEYSIYRVTSTEELSETGTFYVTYKSNANTWQISTAGAGSSGVAFTITPAGQVQYTSTLMGGINYSGKLAFRARSYNPG